MPTLSAYWFDDTDLRGKTDFENISHPYPGAVFQRASLNGKSSALVRERADGEDIRDLVVLFNNSLALQAIDNNLNALAKRTSAVRAGWRIWHDVEYHDQDPSRHGDLDLLVRLSFDIHVTTPWFCSDVDATINYYVVPYLSARVLGVYVDGWAFTTGYGSACRDGVRDQLRKDVPGASITLQHLIDVYLATTFGTSRFFDLYLLPGAGENIGSGTTNVDDHVSLVLIPLHLVYTPPS
jgi:hypothetical protein